MDHTREPEKQAQNDVDDCVLAGIGFEIHRQRGQQNRKNDQKEFIHSFMIVGLLPAPHQSVTHTISAPFGLTAPVLHSFPRAGETFDSVLIWKVGTRCRSSKPRGSAALPLHCQTFVRLNWNPENRAELREWAQRSLDIQGKQMEMGIGRRKGRRG